MQSSTKTINTQLVDYVKCNSQVQNKWGGGGFKHFEKLLNREVKINGGKHIETLINKEVGENNNLMMCPGKCFPKPKDGT